MEINNMPHVSNPKASQPPENEHTDSQFSSDDLPWKTLSTKVIYENPWITLRQDEVINPMGKSGMYTLLEANQFIIVVAIKDDAFIMIEQYRYAIKRKTIEFPAGGIESGESPLEAAKRELQEEAGYSAKQWDYVGPFFDLVSATNQQGHLFIARDLQEVTDTMKEDGISRCFSVTTDLLKTMIDRGDVIDTVTPAALYRAQIRLDQEKA